MIFLLSANIIFIINIKLYWTAFGSSSKSIIAVLVVIDPYHNKLHLFCILIMEILQAKVRLLQNFPQKVVLDTKKTKLSLIQLTIY